MRFDESFVQNLEDKIKSLEEELESVKAANKHLEEQVLNGVTLISQMSVKWTQELEKNTVLVEALNQIILRTPSDNTTMSPIAIRLAREALAKVGVK